MRKKRIAVICFVLTMMCLTIIPMAASAKPGNNLVTFSVSKDFSSDTSSVGYLNVEHSWKLGGLLDSDYLRGILRCPNTSVTDYLYGKIDLELTNVDNVTKQNYDSDYQMIGKGSYAGKGLRGELWKKTKICRGMYTAESNLQTLYFTGS